MELNRLWVGLPYAGDGKRGYYVRAEHYDILLKFTQNASRDDQAPVLQQEALDTLNKLKEMENTP